MAELLNRKQAADYIGVKEGTLAVWASERRYGVPFIRVGRLCRYRREDLDRWLEGRRVEPGRVEVSPERKRRSGR